MPRLADPELPRRRRTQILDAARVCFAERGFRQTTIEDICAEARMSAGALYRYFESKADIFVAIAHDASGATEAKLSRLGDADGLLEGLAEVARAVLSQDDATLLADHWAEALRDPMLAKAMADRERAMQDCLAAAIGSAQARGDIHPALGARDISALLVATLNGMALSGALAKDAAAIGRFRSLALHLLKPKR